MSMVKCDKQYNWGFGGIGECHLQQLDVKTQILSSSRSQYKGNLIQNKNFVNEHL